MREYHFHPDKIFIIRENSQIIAHLKYEEIFNFDPSFHLDDECNEIQILGDGIVYATVGKTQVSLDHNPLEVLISKEQEIIDYYVSGSN